MDNEDRPQSLFKIGFEVGLGFWLSYTIVDWISYGIFKIITKLFSKGVFL